MKSIIESDHFAERIKVVAYPAGFRTEEGIREIEVELSCNDFDEYISGVFIDGIHIEQRDVTVRSPYELRVSHDFPFLKMQFEQQGYSCFQSTINSVMDVEINNHCHQLIYIPEVKGRLNYVRDRGTLEIKLMPEFLKKIFGEELLSLGNFGKAVLMGSPTLLNSKSLPITTQMQQLIQDIRTCSFTGLMKKVYLECKVSELLLLQVQQVSQVQAEDFNLKGADLEKLYYAKSLIEQDLGNPKTILQLSQMSGLNDFKLKREFKRVFGTTVFGYLTDYRLKRAKNMILEGESINEVAYKIGYKQPQHFASAFRRFFGYAPSELKRMIR